MPWLISVSNEYLVENKCFLQNVACDSWLFARCSSLHRTYYSTFCLESPLVRVLSNYLDCRSLLTCAMVTIVSILHDSGTTGTLTWSHTIFIIFQMTLCSLVPPMCGSAVMSSSSSACYLARITLFRLLQALPKEYLSPFHHSLPVYLTTSLPHEEQLWHEYAQNHHCSRQLAWFTMFRNDLQVLPECFIVCL